MDPVIPNDSPAPEFTLPDLDGQRHALADYRGRIVVVNFWSAECPWAQRADRELHARLATWGDDVVLLPIAANANETHALLRQESSDRGLPLVLHDADQAVADRYGARTTPHLFVIDPQGILRYQGALDDVTFRRREPTRAYLRQAVDAILAGQRPDPALTPPYGCTLVRHAP